MNCKKIIHIATDAIFFNNAFFQFENLYEGENTYYILVEDCNEPLRFIQKTKQIKLIQNNVKSLKTLPNEFDQAKIICFHGMNYYESIVLNNTPNKYKTLWLMWGSEIYNNPKFFSPKELLGNQTYKIYKSRSIKIRLPKYFSNVLREIKYQLLNNTQQPLWEISKALKKVNYCGVLYQEEFDMIKRKVISELKFIKYSYYPIEKMVFDLNQGVNHNNILLGNSASYSNNHLEAFELLKKLSLKSRKVITPLSYGIEEYKNRVIKEGNIALGNNFLPLTEFMALYDYNKYLQQCGIVIMNHIRQQAVGNVVTMLFLGAKVYLNEENSLYHYLKRIGVYVFSIEKDLKPSNKSCLTLLSNEKQVYNKNILFKELGQDVLLKELRIHLENMI